MKNFLLLGTLLLLAACGGSSKNVATVDTPDDTKTPAPQNEMYCADIIERKDLPDTLELPLATIVNFEKKRGCVCVTYRYSGCREGETLMTYNSEFQESNRPEVMLQIGVLNAGLCEEIQVDSACFSMKKMQLIGNEVLIYINSKKNNLLLDFNGTPTD